eukprot:TRINITY_DN6409_c0_g1_i5.p1 TRINITY_DN6409_c0_g1~~TRINITY_DN6409_c0_g1_i5.p1  ORF type:complete len:216 (-),score=68.72 TRINITY_DN6409_c0_g1_i5:172-819(-)
MAPTSLLLRAALATSIASAAAHVAPTYDPVCQDEWIQNDLAVLLQPINASQPITWKPTLFFHDIYSATIQTGIYNTQYDNAYPFWRYTTTFSAPTNLTYLMDAEGHGYMRESPNWVLQTKKPNSFAVSADPVVLYAEYDFSVLGTKAVCYIICPHKVNETFYMTSQRPVHPSTCAAGNHTKGISVYLSDIVARSFVLMPNGDIEYTYVNLSLIHI